MLMRQLARNLVPEDYTTVSLVEEEGEGEVRVRIRWNVLRS